MNFTKIRNQINMALTGSSTNRRKRRSLTENAFGISAGNVTTEHIEGSENTFSFESNGKTITGFLEKRDNGTIDAVVVCGSYDVVKGASKSEIVEKIRSAASKLCGVAEDVLLPPENKARGSKEISEAERNWAEHDKQLRENPTLEQAEGLGRSHAGYGWSCKPYGNWSPEHQEAYRRGYMDARRVGSKEISESHRSSTSASRRR
jgi:hypothetical protein